MSKVLPLEVKLRDIPTGCMFIESEKYKTGNYRVRIKLSAPAPMQVEGDMCLTTFVDNLSDGMLLKIHATTDVMPVSLYREEYVQRTVVKDSK